MTKITIEVSAATLIRLQRRAGSHGLPLPTFLELILERQATAWPDRFFEEVVGGWHGEPLTRPEQLPEGTDLS